MQRTPPPLPAAEFAPGGRTEKFRPGADRLLVGTGGKSRISMEDFAILMAAGSGVAGGTNRNHNPVMRRCLPLRGGRTALQGIFRRTGRMQQ
jgi:hypothetical protein